MFLICHVVLFTLVTKYRYYSCVLHLCDLHVMSALCRKCEQGLTPQQVSKSEKPNNDSLLKKKPLS